MKWISSIAGAMFLVGCVGTKGPVQPTSPPMPPLPPGIKPTRTIKAAVSPVSVPRPLTLTPTVSSQLSFATVAGGTNTYHISKIVWPSVPPGLVRFWVSRDLPTSESTPASLLMSETRLELQDYTIDQWPKTFYWLTVDPLPTDPTARQAMIAQWQQSLNLIPHP